MINKNVLVTGGNGMIGKRLVELLEHNGANVHIADLPNDLRDRKTCKEVCEGMDYIFHLAGIKGSPQRTMEQPASFSVPMIQFNANMIEAAYNAGVECFYIQVRLVFIILLKYLKKMMYGKHFHRNTIGKLVGLKELVK